MDMVWKYIVFYWRANKYDDDHSNFESYKIPSKIFTYVKKEDGNEAFQFACKTGHIKMVQMLIKRSARFKIDLNAKIVRFSWVSFVACKFGNLQIGWLRKKSTEFNIDLNAKDKFGKTGFQLAC